MCKSEEKCEKEGLETVKEKLERTNHWLHEVTLRMVTMRIIMILWHQVKNLEQDVNKMRREEIVSLLRRRLGQCCAEMQDIQDIWVESVNTKLSPRQLAFLETEAETADPSVQFFGLEWESVFQRCSSLGANIHTFKQCLVSNVVDILGLASILQELRRLEGELGDHLVALLAGRLGSAGRLNDRLQYQVQQAGHLQVHQDGHFCQGSSGNLNTRPGTVTSSSQVKYIKTKTENLSTKIQITKAADIKSDRRSRRKSTVVESSPVKKKSSFVQKVSDLFIDYI